MMRRIKTLALQQAGVFGLVIVLFTLTAFTPPFRQKNLPVDPAAVSVEVLFREKFANLNERELQKLVTLFLKLCRQYDFSPAFILGLIEVESSFRPDVVSFAGAIGLMQVMPATAEPIARELGLGWKGKRTLADPTTNLKIGFHYLAYLRTRFDGKSHKYITAYNWGPGRVGSILQSRGELPLGYFHKVERTKQQYAFVDGRFGL